MLTLAIHYNPDSEQLSRIQTSEAWRAADPLLRADILQDILYVLEKRYKTEIKAFHGCLRHRNHRGVQENHVTEEISCEVRQEIGADLRDLAEHIEEGKLSYEEILNQLSSHIRTVVQAKIEPELREEKKKRPDAFIDAKVQVSWDFAYMGDVAEEIIQEQETDEAAKSGYAGAREGQA